MLNLRRHAVSETYMPSRKAIGRAMQPGDDDMTAGEECTANNALLALTFDMSGDRKPAQPAGGRPLDGGVRRHVAWHTKRCL